MCLKCDLQIVASDDEEQIVFARDLNLGNTSVTNDVEAVTRWMHDRYPEHRYVYRDSENNWTEIVHDAGRFLDWIPFNGDTPL